VRRWTAILLLFVSTVSPQFLCAEPQERIVVAHWILPIRYSQSENYNESLKNDIRAALELGLDGFALDCFTEPQAEQLFADFIQSADSIGATNFKLFLSADMSGKISGADIVRVLEKFGANPHYLKVKDRPLLSTYGGDSLGDAWWRTTVLSPLRDAGMQVTFVPYFDRPNPNGDAPDLENWTKVIRRFPSIDGLFDFLMPGSGPFYSDDDNIGHHWWSTLEADEALSQALRASGKIYMATYMPYYWAVCHSARQYLEFQAARGMKNWWTSIIGKQATNLVEIVTWNDYSESTFIQPTRIPGTEVPGVDSEPHLGFYELLKYYIAWFRSGKRPGIAKDGLFIFYRMHRNKAQATNDAAVCSLGPVPASQKWGKIEDLFYIATAMTSPGSLTVQVGSNKRTYLVPAGLHELDVPMSIGRPRIELSRGGKPIAYLETRAVVGKPIVYNYNVYSAYVFAEGESSETWIPSDRWKTGYIADWFN
jgi:glucan endo-1,3-alpha-glucosidase